MFEELSLGKSVANEGSKTEMPVELDLSEVGKRKDLSKNKGKGLGD